MDTLLAQPGTLVAGFGLGLSLIVAIGAQNAFILRQGARREHLLAVVLLCVASDLVLITAGVAGFGALLDAAPWVVEAMRWGGIAFLLGYGALAARRALKGGGVLSPNREDESADAADTETAQAADAVSPAIARSAAQTVASLTAPLTDTAEASASARDGGSSARSASGAAGEAPSPDAMPATHMPGSSAVAAGPAAPRIRPASRRAATLVPVVLTTLALTWLNPHVYLDTVVLLGSVANTHGPDGRWVFALGACVASVTWFAALGLGARALSGWLATPRAWRWLDASIAVVMLSLAASLALS